MQKKNTKKQKPSSKRKAVKPALKAKTISKTSRKGAKQATIKLKNGSVVKTVGTDVLTSQNDDIEGFLAEYGTPDDIRIDDPTLVEEDFFGDDDTVYPSI